MTPKRTDVAIVDYGLGNLYSVARACECVGLDAQVTSEKGTILAASSVILPGVGAFGDAMENLKRLDLVGPLRQIALSGKPLYGICLGLQLLMSESEEFGSNRGLNIIPGTVSHFGRPTHAGRLLKVPQVGWNRVHAAPGAAQDSWEGTPLSSLTNGSYQYFVHSYYIKPEDPAVILSTTRYGDVEFCSSIKAGSVVAFQFHPERSGPSGIQIYHEIAKTIKNQQHLEGNKDAA